MFNYFSDQSLGERNGLSATISIRNWLAFLALSLFAIIPFVGVIVSLVLYLVLAFRHETAPSISNFIKAYLVIAVISLVLGLVLFGSLIGITGALIGG